MREYNQRPEVKKHRKEYYQRPEVKKHRKEYQRKYHQRPEVKKRKKEYQKEYCRFAREIQEQVPVLMERVRKKLIK